MSLGYSIAIAAVPFLDLLDKEVEDLAAQLLDAGDSPESATSMDAARRRLAQGVDSSIRALPAAVRGDQTASRAVAYALVGLADERMLHHPAGGLHRWRERLLEFELYGSALAGQEIVNRARATAFGATGAAVGGGEESEHAYLAPLYLAVFRSGFEGSLRGDSVGLTSLMASLGEAVGGTRQIDSGLVSDVRPTRSGMAPIPLAVIGVVIWLVSGFALWLTLPQSSLADAERIAGRISAGLSVGGQGGEREPLERSVGPSGLPALDAGTDDGSSEN